MNFTKGNALALTIGCLLLLFSGCNQSGSKKSLKSLKKNHEAYLPVSTGSWGDITIVINNGLWNGSIGKMIREKMDVFYDGWPSREKKYNIVQVDQLNLGALLKKDGCIIVFEADRTIDSTSFIIKDNLWAKPQRLFSFKAPNKKTLKAMFISYYDQVERQIIDFEAKRSRVHNLKNKNKAATQILKNQYGIDMIVPKGMTLAEIRGEFIWLKKHTSDHNDGFSGDVDQGIFIYFQNYNSANDFTKAQLIKARNKFLKKHVPGPVENSYMQTEMHQVFQPRVNESEVLGQYAAEMRGWWRIENYFMGGPFTSITRFDKTNNRLVTIESYVYAPNFDKLPLLREIESITRSVRFIPKKQS